MIVTSIDGEQYALRPAHPYIVFVAPRLSQGGLTPNGIMVNHSEDLPECDGVVVAIREDSPLAGQVLVGDQVTWPRYSTEFLANSWEDKEVEVVTGNIFDPVKKHVVKTNREIHAVNVEDLELVVG